MKKADLKRFICEKYSKACFQIRNECRVNHSARVIAVYNGEAGETRNTIVYFQYDVRKEQKLKHNGESYRFSPYALVWNGDYYYMVGFSEKHNGIGNFRIDRIASTPQILDEEAVPTPEDFDIAEYTNGMLRMYNSERCDVELICDNSVMDAIMDKFGNEVKTYAYDMTSFKLEANVAVNHVFFSWVFGFGGLVKIKAPDNVKQEYANMVKKTIEKIK